MKSDRIRGNEPLRPGPAIDGRRTASWLSDGTASQAGMNWLAVLLTAIVVLSLPVSHCAGASLFQDDLPTPGSPAGGGNDGGPGEENAESGAPPQDTEPPQETDTPQEPEVQERDPAEQFATAEEAAEAIQFSVIDRDPFDRLHFDEEDVPTLDVDPLEVEGYSPNQPINPDDLEGRAEFTIPDYPGRRFAAQWSQITKVERYADMVMEEAQNAMDAEDFNTAFRTLLFLIELPDVGRTAELNQMLDRCIYMDGMAQLDAGNFGDALAAFEELYIRNPRYRTGDKEVYELIIDVYDNFLESEFEQGNYQAVRDLLQGMRVEYGNRVDEEIARWDTKLRDRAIERLRNVRDAVESDNGMLAQKEARNVLYAMPELEQAQIAMDTVIEAYPWVFVGVTAFPDEPNPLSVENWDARRVGRLLVRTIMEFEGPSDEGGAYLFPNGRLQQIDDLGLRYRFTLSQNLKPGVPLLTAYELSNRLMDLADPESPDYYIPWARMVSGIEIEDEKSVAIRLRFPHVRPESIMPLTYFSPDDPRREQWLGLYEPVDEGDDWIRYDFNEDQYEHPSGQLPTVIEQRFANSSEAVDALLRGDIDVVDRVHPLDLSRLRSNPDISVRPYLIPQVNVLIPNPRNEFMRSDNFRRAIQVGINTDLMIREALTGGREIDGFQVVSGPFPPGTDAADELSYAYNNEIQPRQYDFRLALVLAQQFVIEEERRQERETGDKVDVVIPEIVLVHPNNDTVRGACKSIQQQLGSVGIPIVLKELPPGATVPEDDEYDLLYSQIQIQEPLVDAYRLLGHNGLVQISDPTIEQALRDLDSALSWAEISRSLRRVHRQTHANLTVLPLWQSVEYYAYRNNLYNIGDRLVYLYQNITEWHIGGIRETSPVASSESREP